MTVQLTRKHKLREEYALLWLIASASIVVLSVFSGVVGFLASFFGISYTPTLPLVFGLLFALAVLLSQSVVLSNQSNQNRDLAQSLALMEFRLRELEEQVELNEEERPPAEDEP